jgi:hypothetical protein
MVSIVVDRDKSVQLDDDLRDCITCSYSLTCKGYAFANTLDVCIQTRTC